MADERHQPGSDALTRSAEMVGGALGTAVNTASQASDFAGSAVSEIGEIAAITTERSAPARRAVKRTVKRAVKRARRAVKASTRRSARKTGAKRSRSAAKKAARSKKGTKKTAGRKKR